MKPMARMLALGLLGAVACARGEPNSATSPGPSVPALGSVENGYLKVGFDQLASYTFTPPAFDPAASKPASGEEQIPAAIKALDGHKVVITGYMVPVKMDKGLVTEFLLMRNTLACCFGGVPNMNEWVIVTMPQGVQSLVDTPISLYGQLKVGAMFENGYITGIYRLAADKLAEAK
jgi:hypothetical protein